ncbi:MAG: hypothetical protein JWQ09_2340 [Segetibacter sp.]|nr:hypothetical protein [Segetibacter sp.]
MRIAIQVEVPEVSIWMFQVTLAVPSTGTMLNED